MSLLHPSDRVISLGFNQVFHWEEHGGLQVMLGISKE
jgi:hypothetical protein